MHKQDVVNQSSCRRLIQEEHCIQREIQISFSLQRVDDNLIACVTNERKKRKNELK